jgi:hypothetical protein
LVGRSGLEHKNEWKSERKGKAHQIKIKPNHIKQVTQKGKQIKALLVFSV